MSQPSPYTPGTVAKRVPGRRQQLAFYEERAQYIATLGAFSARVRVDFAARGVGKTSLLREAERVFERHGIRTVWVTADEDESLAQAILAELRTLGSATSRRGKALIAAIDSATVTIGAAVAKASVTVKRPPGTGESAAKAFMRAVTAASDAIVDADGAGIAILVDEMQSADKASLRTVAHAWQELASEPTPPRAGLFGVGLPGSRDRINGAVTFSERFDFVELFGIDEAGAAEALAGAAYAVGVTWDVDALRVAVDAAEGYPYKVQLIGEAAWVAAGYPESGGRINLSNLRAGMPEVERQMHSLFQARWRNSSTKQRELLIAIAKLGGHDVKREDIAVYLGVHTTKISMAREGLLRKGIVDASRHGHLSFTVPGFTEFILERAE